MKKIEAYKCELTGGLYEDRERAVRSEFKAMMKGIGGSLPHMGSVNSSAIMEWLAGHIESEIYPTVLDKLITALEYYKANRKASGVVFETLGSPITHASNQAHHPRET